jgi:hypothetical protein
VEAELAGVVTTSPAEADAGSDYYYDAHGRRVEFAPIYEGWFGDKRYPPRYARAIGENAAMLAFELFLYWYDPHSNAVDWQYPDLGAKFSSNEVVRFDDNMQMTNFLLHPLAGGAHYGLSRLNGLGIPASFGAAALSSTLYEGVFEWREVVSINDLIVTPIAGMAVGETLFQLGNYLNSRVEKPTRELNEEVGPQVFGQRLARVTLGLPRRAHDIVDEPAPPPIVEDDNLGLSSAYAHEFRAHFGVAAVTNDRHELGENYVLRFQTRLAAMPGFLRAGHIDTWFWSGNFTSIATRIGFDDRLRDVDVTIDAHVFGHYHQALDVGKGGVRGTALELAGHTALHYTERWLFDRRDHYAALHVMGPIGTLWLCAGKTELRLSADVSPDFAAIRSLAYEKWVERYGATGTKSSLLLHGYYNAWGVSTGASAALRSHDVSLSTEARFGHYESIDGLERFREKVTEEPHDYDDVLELGATLAFEPRASAFSARLDFAHVGRASKMGPFSAPRYDQSVGVSVGARF